MQPAMRLALYQPDIPQNAGAIMRLAACLGAGVDIIGPCGFVLDDRRLRRAGMDYLDGLDMIEHTSWAAYLAARAPGGPSGGSGRIILLTTGAEAAYTGIRYAVGDTLLLGQESAGVPEDVESAADLAVRIPMTAAARSLNVALAAAIVLGEARRQIGDGLA